MSQESAILVPSLNLSWFTVVDRGPYKSLHLDFAKLYQGKMFLAVIDACSKYLEVVPMSQPTGAHTYNCWFSVSRHSK